MEIDMDIPAPEELEWLESNTAFDEELDYNDEFFVDPDDDVENGNQNNPPGKFSNTSAADAHDVFDELPKRKRGDSVENEIPEVDLVDVDDEGDGEGRVLKKRVLEDDDDEEWLRYSPPVIVDVGIGVVTEMEPVAEKILSRYAMDIEGECIPVTGPSGDRVYAKICAEELAGNVRKLHGLNLEKGLLLEPISELSRKVEQESLMKALQASVAPPSVLSQSTKSVDKEQLWVEKYAPSSFTELLSDEQTNREVLLWLKQWDYSVFGSQVRVTTDDVLSALRMHSAVVQQQKLYNKSYFNKSKVVHSSNQSFNHSNIAERGNIGGSLENWSKTSTNNHPPEQKVLLLCGPPGLGKTTLAHVAAQHCGYRVVEINASDDRSASTIESKILDVVQMNSVMPDSKPKCLIIDEIDGALGEGKGAVEVILKMIAAEKKPNSDKQNAAQDPQPGKIYSKKSQKQAALSRPIICICNDLYAPALRQLRQVAKVHVFVQPKLNRIVSRLKFICKKEGFRTNTTALSALAEYTDCDIRSCLNTLQFLHKKKETLNILELGSVIVGQKDISRSAIDVWKEVFQIRRKKSQRTLVNGYYGHDNFDYMSSLISNRGEYELTMDGIHENFLRLSYHDPMMQKTVKCLNTLGFSDSLLQYVSRTHNMSLYAYQPSTAIAISRLIAQVEKPNIEWPKAFNRSRQMLIEKKDLLKTWQHKIAPPISRHLSIKSIVEDVLSLFLYILSPSTLRPVDLHLLSEKEKEDLFQLVDTMISYSITYKISKPLFPEKIHKNIAAHDVPFLVLDPPLHDFVNFQEYVSQHYGLSGVMKQVLVHQVEKQRIVIESSTKTTNAKDARIPSPTPTVDKAITSVDGGRKSEMTSNQRPSSGCSISNKDGKQSLPSITGSKNVGTSKKTLCCPANFFDRFRKERGTISKNNQEALQATSARDSRPFLFKFNEGYTNAVKRPVRIRDLL